MPDLLKTLALTVASVLFVLAGLVIAPAFAAAATYTVNVTGNVTPDVGCTDPGDDCDLWEAIDLSNSTPGVVDTIEFEVAEVAVNTELPVVVQPVVIDGTGALGRPGVEIVDAGGSLNTGLEIEANDSVITGVVLVGFFEQLLLTGQRAQVCNSYLGMNLSGEPEGGGKVGVWIEGEAADTEIGAGCASGNVISGNGWFGLIDNAVRTHVAGNLIGTDAAGDLPVPNGFDPQASEPAGGIYAQGSDLRVGGTAPGEGNVIAYNQGAGGFGGIFGGGVVLKSESTAIRGNSIFANEEQGINFWVGISGPIPALGSAASSEITGTTVVAGTIEGEPDTAFAIDLFANAECDEYQTGFDEFAEAGEGETYLGSVEVEADSGGTAKFEATVPVQPEGTVLTATGTILDEGTSTSEFSGCLVAPKPVPKPTPPPVDPPKAPIQAIAAVALEPVNGESLAAEPLEGVIYIKLPGKAKQVKLTEGMLIPVGSIIDASKGKVTLTSVNKAGETQTAVFFGGRFLVAQRDGAGLVTLQLRGPLKGCGEASGSAATASAAKGRRLWGSGKGKFRTEGNYGSATVRGTVWLTEDRCRATFFKVRKGVVTVRDFTAAETFSLGKGKSYLATP